MSITLRDGIMTLTGNVGPSLFGDGFTAGEVALALASVDDDAPLTVRLSSAGGYADDGTAIYNAFRARVGDVHVVVTGMAASAGSLIAMAGDRITMASGSLMMVHEPMMTLLNANGADLASAAQAQAAYLNGYVAIYARRTKRNPADIRAMLKQTVWFDAPGAVEAGFADDEEGEADAELPAFDYRVYARAPERLTAMASAKHWQFDAAVSLDARAERARADRAEAELGTLRAFKAQREREDDRDRAMIESGLVRADGRLNGQGLTGATSPPRSRTASPVWNDFLKGRD